MKKLFENFGIEIFEEDNRYFVRYDEGEIAAKIRMMEVTEEDALLMQISEDKAYQIIIKYQNRGE